MKKRAAGHIEVILAMILFMGFVGVALYFFSPVNSSRLIDSSLGYVFSEVKKNTTVELDIYSAKLSQGNYDPVISLTIENINDAENKKGEKVKNKDYLELESAKEGNTIRIKREENDFFYIAISEDLQRGIPSGSLSGGQSLREDQYTLGTSSSRRVISEKRIKILNETYRQNYQNLKDYFNIPGRVDFNFELAFYDGYKISPGKEIEGEEIYSKSDNVEVLRENGETEFAVLRVSVW